MTPVDHCLACDTLNGKTMPPGGIIYSNDFWQVDHALPPIFVLGILIIKLKQHKEHLAELTIGEAQVIGPLIQRVCHVLQDLTGAEKIHVASYGEGVRHVHFIVTPRKPGMPASNIRLVYWLHLRRILYRAGWKRSAQPPEHAIELAQKLRLELMPPEDG